MDRSGSRVLTFALALVVAACSGSGHELPAAEARVVAFRQRDLVIDHLESPTRPPYAVGSTPSRELLTSTNPSVVDLDPSGDLIGHRNGEAEIRAAGGASLHVLVRAVRSLKVEPNRLSIPVGGQAALRLFADGSSLPPEAVRWQTSDPNIAAASGSAVRAGLLAGTATLTAMAGDGQASVEVAVTPRLLAGVNVQPTHAELKVGSVQRLSLDAGALAGIDWTSSNKAVLQPMRDGLFYAKGIGKSKACAVAGDRKSCALISVNK
jgi:hypothetical protein